jgi:glutamate formiminotransferase / formiminotetrahydrofolate cyclodeaminase
MSYKLVECVPNFSNGRDPEVIKEITDAIVAAGGVELLDVDPGEATNRTVVTFVGPPETVVDAAFAGIAKAAQIIDMREHSGAHPRFGATDVCPFVPVEGVTMEECAELARQLGKRVGEELGIPVYLYEHAASTPERRNLANVRRGEYEALPERLADPHWKPDFGPAEFNARAGATAMSAREFLVAYNVTLNTTEKGLANDIAFEIRQKGRSARDGDIDQVYGRGEVLYHREGALRCGECEFTTPGYEALEAHVREVHGWELKPLLDVYAMKTDGLVDKPVKKRGAFDHCKAIGWFVEEYGRAQISINLTNYKITPPHIVLEKVRELAVQRGLIVTGSEIVGLVPLQAMVMAGRWYMERQGRTTGLPPQDLVEIATWSMGLNDVSEFDPASRVLGYPKLGDERLMALGAKEFVDEVSRPSPAPGGGSVAALAGSLGAGLASMVANLSAMKFRAKSAGYIAQADRCQQLKEELVRLVDLDTDAFNDYLVAVRLPQGTEAEKANRDDAIQAGLVTAIKVPLRTAQVSFETLQLCKTIAREGLKASVSDAGVGAAMAHVGLVGGALNVLINLKQVTDEAFKAEMVEQCAQLREEGATVLAETMTIVGNRIAGRKRQQG